MLVVVTSTSRPVWDGASSTEHDAKQRGGHPARAQGSNGTIVARIPSEGMTGGPAAAVRPDDREARCLLAAVGRSRRSAGRLAGQPAVPPGRLKPDANANTAAWTRVLAPVFASRLEMWLFTVAVLT